MERRATSNALPSARPPHPPGSMRRTSGRRSRRTIRGKSLVISPSNNPSLSMMFRGAGGCTVQSTPRQQRSRTSPPCLIFALPLCRPSTELLEAFRPSTELPERAYIPNTNRGLDIGVRFGHLCVVDFQLSLSSHRVPNSPSPETS